MRFQLPGCWLLAVAIAVVLPGCADEFSVVEPPTEMVFVDVESGSPVTAPPSTDLPAVHPDTGRRTLMPGLHCASCQKWHPAPPLEELQRPHTRRNAPPAKAPSPPMVPHRNAAR